MNIKNLDLTIDEISMLQLGDSFFPTGMYTTSSGLEALFYNKRIKSKEQISEFISVCLKYQLGPADCTALSNSHKAAQSSDLKTIIEIDDLLFSMKLVKEIREASTRSGTQLLNCVLSFINETPTSENIYNKDNNSSKSVISSYFDAIKSKDAHGVYPIALGLASNVLNITRERACMLLLYGFTVSIVGAALRLGMFPHFEGQQIIHSLKPVILEVIKKNIDRAHSKMWQFSPGIDILQISHERMDSKMFIT
ncbi:MAG: urease accessory protein [Nitrososphaeraceae archaeon]|nr:urease accessory protein [Nitrososphaeraceae archaeon]